jgi:diguanylate cyclase (GGDEF)-like protein/PAS domain S-box-containing protein
MVRKPASARVWASLSGVVITIVSAALLAGVLWQVFRLESFGGLDPSAAARYRVAMRSGADVMATLEAVADYRHAYFLGGTPMQVRALRNVVGARMKALGLLFDADGQAHGLDSGHDWPAATKAWNALEKRPIGSENAFRPLTLHLENLIFSCDNNSGLNYDSNAATQNLAGIVFINIPTGYEAVERSQVRANIAMRRGGMSLRERLAFNNAIGTVDAEFDLTGSDLPGAVQAIQTLVPGPNRFAGLPADGNAFVKAGSRYYHLMRNQVLFADRPHVDPNLIRARADDAIATARRLEYGAISALQTIVSQRERIFNQRKQYVYIAILVTAVLVIGLMLVMAQIVARRSSQALQRAQDESERLAAELARQHAEEALRLSEAQFKAVFEGAAVGIAVVDRDNHVVDSNSVFRSLFGDSITAALDGHEGDLAELLAGERDTFEYEQHLRTALGQEVWTDATVSIVNQRDGKPLFAICMFRDKTALKHSERRMLHDKTHDALTGLPNRWLFEEHLRRRFEEATALLDSFFAVLFIDLEHFRDINESLGHGAGDSVLTQVAQRLRSSVDARDVVARLGSDEFAVLLQSLGDILHVESVARRVINNLSKVISIGGRAIYLGARVGIAIGSASYERAEDVMRDAEIAMQHSKIGGGARFALFDSTMHDRAQKRLQLSTDIRQALERSEFRLLYQPIVNLEDGSPVGCEALLRWDHPIEGVMSPTEFMPIAEQTGLATPIGRFVVNTACEQLSAWRRNRNGHMNFTLHVNVSAAELDDVDFERALVQAIEHHGLSPHDLTIEITESVVLDSGTRANTTLERIRDRGFKICIDDFGTGYSSLRYLQQFKVDAIKIDRGFVSGSDGELASEPIVRTLMTLAEAFDVRVVAEGVETVRQREILRNAGCRLAQGFLYSRPISADEIVTLYPEALGRLPRSASA